MARGRCMFTQADVKRAVAGVLAAGLPLDRLRIEIDRDGKIVIESGSTQEPTKTALDEWRASRARSP